MDSALLGRPSWAGPRAGVLAGSCPLDPLFKVRNHYCGRPREGQEVKHSSVFLFAPWFPGHSWGKHLMQPSFPGSFSPSPLGTNCLPVPSGTSWHCCFLLAMQKVPKDDPNTHISNISYLFVPQEKPPVCLISFKSEIFSASDEFGTTEPTQECCQIQVLLFFPYHQQSRWLNPKPGTLHYR